MTTFASPYLKPPPAYVASERTRRRIAGMPLYEAPEAYQPKVEAPQPAPRPAVHQFARMIQCRHCGKPFRPRNDAHIYCNDGCQRANKPEREAARRRAKGIPPRSMPIGEEKIRLVLKKTAETFHVPIEDVLSARLPGLPLHVRQGAMMLAKDILGAQLAEIGAAMGGRTKALAAHSIRVARLRCNATSGPDWRWAQRLAKAERLCRAEVTP